jgi:glycosyltransferase involved in cell wall biosynthesis
VKRLISILIPAFNERKWIASTLESAIGQTWPRKEIIVVDDGSTDDTLAIARRFASKGVAFVTQEHQGAAAARNMALSVSQGDYIQWLDANDLLAADKIERQVLELDRCSSRMLLSSAWGRFMYRHYRAEFVPTGLWRDLSPVEWLLCKVRDNVFMQTATWLVSRELTEAAGPWNTRLHVDDDGEYFRRVLLASDGVRFVPQSRVFYRMSGRGRLSQIGRSDRKIEANFRSIEANIRCLLSLEDSERVRAACMRYLQTGLVYAYPERPDIVEAAGRIAEELGGRLTRPTLPRKYAPIDALFGRVTARRVQSVFQPMRWWLARLLDRTRFRLDQLTGLDHDSMTGEGPVPAHHSVSPEAPPRSQPFDERYTRPR